MVARSGGKRKTANFPSAYTTGKRESEGKKAALPTASTAESSSVAPRSGGTDVLVARTPPKAGEQNVHGPGALLLQRPLRA